MIDETSVVTYYSQNATRDDLAWTAYVLLPNGEYWGVRFNGATEEIAKTKAIALWNSEKDKWNKYDSVDNDPWNNPLNRAISNQPKQHHFAGKVWMRHKVTRELVRVPMTEIGMYEKNNYERSGPRSK